MRTVMVSALALICACALVAAVAKLVSGDAGGALTVALAGYLPGYALARVCSDI